MLASRQRWQPGVQGKRPERLFLAQAEFHHTPTRAPGPLKDCFSRRPSSIHPLALPSTMRLKQAPPTLQAPHLYSRTRPLAPLALLAARTASARTHK